MLALPHTPGVQPTLAGSLSCWTTRVDVQWEQEHTTARSGDPLAYVAERMRECAIDDNRK